MYNDDAVQRRIDELSEEMEEALAAGRQGEAEELYMELEEICRENR